MCVLFGWLGEVSVFLLCYTHFSMCSGTTCTIVTSGYSTIGECKALDINNMANHVMI